MTFATSRGQPATISTLRRGEARGGVSVAVPGTEGAILARLSELIEG